MSDPEILLMLASWFDIQQKLGYWPDTESNEIQDDLRRIAGRLDQIDEIEYLQKQNEIEEKNKCFQ